MSMIRLLRYSSGMASSAGLISVSALPLESVVVLINEWGTAPRVAAGEHEGHERDNGATGHPRAGHSNYRRH